jgi:DNA-binding transcriptional MerR regulator
MVVVGFRAMRTLTIQQAADATGWSQRMLRYLEQAGLVAALRTPGGHRTYGPRQIERLQRLRDLLAEHGIGITDIAFELRVRTDPGLARAVDEWFGAIHRATASVESGIYRRLTSEEQFPVPVELGENVSLALTADSAGAVTDFTELADPIWPAVDGRFAVPVPDFALSELDLTGSAHIGGTGPAIVLCIDAGGSVEAFGSAVDVERGRAAFVGARDAAFVVRGAGRVFVATVGPET